MVPIPAHWRPLFPSCRWTEPHPIHAHLNATLLPLPKAQSRLRLDLVLQGTTPLPPELASPKGLHLQLGSRWESQKHAVPGFSRRGGEKGPQGAKSPTPDSLVIGTQVSWSWLWGLGSGTLPPRQMGTWVDSQQIMYEQRVCLSRAVFPDRSIETGSS